MAEQRKTFPMLPVAHWWALRKKFKQSIPGVVTDNYLATVLSMKVDSARNNVLPYLKVLRIIDEEGKTGERARSWRDDAAYPDMCKAMLKDVYPDELLQAVPNPSEDRAGAERWFANHTGTGESAAKRMAALYAVIAEADPTTEPDTGKKKERAQRTQEAGRRRAVAEATPVPRTVTAPERLPDPDGHQHHRPQPPGININLQVHISADATPDQIDQIFASMAKHIYPRG